MSQTPQNPHNITMTEQFVAPTQNPNSPFPPPFVVRETNHSMTPLTFGITSASHIV